jgi:AcrR family transcriptional regulator
LTESRPGLSRDRIITAAIDSVDQRGLTALTTRRLGQGLGVEAMSL